MRDPNNILAIEYLKAMRLCGSAIEPVRVKRLAVGPGGVDAGSGIAGASALRAMFAAMYEEGQSVGDQCLLPVARTGSSRSGDHQYPYGFLPDDSARAIRDYIASGDPLVFAAALFPHLVYAVTMMQEHRKTNISERASCPLSEILSATEGLENRLASAVHRAHDMDEAVRYTKTRRYTETRVRRLILHTVLGLTKAQMAAAIKEPPYARVLAFSEAGAKLIRRAKRAGDIPIISNANREKALLSASPVTFGFDIKAAEFYRLLQKGNIAGFNEYTAR
jgi:predicted nucleotidyltransferase